MKVLVKAPLSPFSGYGRDGIELTTAFENAGCDVYLSPAHVSPPLPANITKLLTKERKAPFDLLIDHQDPMICGLNYEERLSSKLAVLATMWEWTDLQTMPRGTGKSTLKIRLANYDLILPYTSVTQQALEPYTTYKRRKVPQKVLQGGFDPTFWTHRPRNWFTKDLSFIMVGDLGNPRKDAFVAIQAFQELKREGQLGESTLELKTNSEGLHPAMEQWCPGLKIYFETWNCEQVRNFYQRSHVLLAPSQGEGKLLPGMEMAATGGIVAVTNWSGPAGWIHESFCYPLDYVLKADPRTPKAYSARVQKDHLKEKLVHMYANRGELSRKAKIAADYVPKSCSWDNYVSKLFKIVGLNGN